MMSSLDSIRFACLFIFCLHYNIELYAFLQLFVKHQAIYRIGYIFMKFYKNTRLILN